MPSQTSQNPQVQAKCFSPPGFVARRVLASLLPAYCQPRPDRTRCRHWLRRYARARLHHWQCTAVRGASAHLGFRGQGTDAAICLIGRAARGFTGNKLNVSVTSLPPDGERRFKGSDDAHARRKGERAMTTSTWAASHACRVVARFIVALSAIVV